MVKAAIKRLLNRKPEPTETVTGSDDLFIDEVSANLRLIQAEAIVDIIKLSYQAGYEDGKKDVLNGKE